MIKKFAIGIYILAIMLAVFSPRPGIAGGFCQTYQCQQAQQEIQYLYDAIWREKGKQYPNWNWIQQVQNRINWLNQIR